MSRGYKNKTNIPTRICDVIIYNKHTRYIQLKNQKNETIPCTKACELGNDIFPEKVVGGPLKIVKPNLSLNSSKKLRPSLSNALP
jgi:hypothetical protein